MKMKKRNNIYIKFAKNEEWIRLFRKRPTALLLAYLISCRAKRTSDHPDVTLEIGEAYIGDWENYCRSEKIYRNDKKWLEKYQIGAFRGTSRGTIGKIVKSVFIDINPETMGEQLGEQGASKGRARGEQGATNKKVKKVKKVKNREITKEFIDELIVDKRFSLVDVNEEYEKFIDYKKSKGRAYKDNRAAFRNWLRNAVSYVVEKNPDKLLIKKKNDDPLLKHTRLDGMPISD